MSEHLSALFWDRTGAERELSPMPDSMGSWMATRGEPRDNAQRQLLHTVESVLDVKVSSMHVLARGSNFVVLLEYANGDEVVVRTPSMRAHQSVTRDGPAAVARFWREVNLLRWLKAATSIPVPAIKGIIKFRTPRPDLFPYAMLEVMPGEVLMNERLVRSFAKISLQLFRLEVPQRIGTLKLPDEAGGPREVIPWQTRNGSDSAPMVYNTLEEFITFLIHRKLERATYLSEAGGDDHATRARSRDVLSRLVPRLQPILHRLNRPSYRRCVLNHDELNQTNVLVDGDTGEITGVVDWEHQSVRPAVLSASYPLCIRYDGPGDPRFDDDDEGAFWTYVKDRDIDYYRSLVDGDILRQAVEWLCSPTPDSGCANLEKWMDATFTHVA
ncbi:hypothetical protein C8Q77DRAFT_1156797 [Trametes polyzona]|nr:hypothetical protein C8Q77DRAFT_1156797 [Trametes polyzona]